MMGSRKLKKKSRRLKKILRRPVPLTLVRWLPRSKSLRLQTRTRPSSQQRPRQIKISKRPKPRSIACRNQLLLHRRQQKDLMVPRWPSWRLRPMALKLSLLPQRRKCTLILAPNQLKSRKASRRRRKIPKRQRKWSKRVRSKLKRSKLSRPQPRRPKNWSLKKCKLGWRSLVNKRHPQLRSCSNLNSARQSGKRQLTKASMKSLWWKSSKSSTSCTTFSPKINCKYIYVSSQEGS